MADRSSIEWTDASWNPIRARNTATGKVGWHCAHVSEGCRYCYAEGFNRRLGTGLDYKPALLTGGPNRAPEVEVFLDEAMLTQPLRWKQPRKIFVGSMTDLFADFVTDAMLDRIWAVMALCPQHTFQIVTKRPERMRGYLTGEGLTGGRALQIAIELLGPITEGDDPVTTQRLFDRQNRIAGALPPLGQRWPLPNLWLMISAEDQATADTRIPILLDTPAAVRGVSAEPLLGGIDFTALKLPDGWPRCDCVDAHPTINALDASIYCPGCCEGPEAMTMGRLDLVIVGGESGPKARPMHPDWARQVRDQCEDAGVAFFFKQWGEWTETEDVVQDQDESGHTRIDADSDIAEALFDPHRDRLMAYDGRLFAELLDLPPDVPCRQISRVGKKAAGRLLDGREHNDLPGQAA